MPEGSTVEIRRTLSGSCSALVRSRRFLFVLLCVLSFCGVVPVRLFACLVFCSRVVRSACVLEYSGVRIMRSAFSAQTTLCAVCASPRGAAWLLWSKSSVASVSATTATHQQRANKALHPTAYSFVPFARASLRSLRFRRRVSLVVRPHARGLTGSVIIYVGETICKL